MDIGARWGIGWPFCNLNQSEISLLLVEPDPEEAEILKKSYKAKNIDTKIFQTALWSSSKQLSLNLTLSPGCSSVFSPNISILNRFPEADRFSIVKKIDFETDTIDDLVARKKIDNIDFLKVDVQGAELEILNGGKSFLKSSLVGIEVEVEFIEMYKGQPLFSEIDCFIRKELGLELWDLGKTYWKYKNKYQKSTPLKGRLAFGDAIYFRSIEGIQDWLNTFEKGDAKEKIETLIQIVLLYGYIDYAYALMEDVNISKLFSDNEKNSILKKIKKNSFGLNFNFRGSKYLHIFFLTISNIFKPQHKNFAIRNELQLGAKKKLFFWNY